MVSWQAPREISDDISKMLKKTEKDGLFSTIIMDLGPLLCMRDSKFANTLLRHESITPVSRRRRSTALVPFCINLG